MGVTFKVWWQLLVVLAFILNVFVVGESEDFYSETYDGDEDTIVIKGMFLLLLYRILVLE